MLDLKLHLLEYEALRLQICKQYLLWGRPSKTSTYLELFGVLCGVLWIGAGMDYQFNILYTEIY